MRIGVVDAGSVVAAPLQIRVAGQVVESQEDFNQAVLAAISGLMKATGSIGFGMPCALPTGERPRIEIALAPVVEPAAKEG